MSVGSRLGAHDLLIARVLPLRMEAPFILSIVLAWSKPTIKKPRVVK